MWKCVSVSICPSQCHQGITGGRSWVQKPINLVDTFYWNGLIAADTYNLHKDEFAPPLDSCDIGKVLLKHLQ